MQARRPSVEVGELLLVKRANGAVWRSAKQVRLIDNGTIIFVIPSSAGHIKLHC